ncbi:MAG: polymer-forming cytoskeletal protein [Neisseriaceae bacterium]|nr:polymer-forming cytoskeletal protein [Neisseriaceae bacterium]
MGVFRKRSHLGNDKHLTIVAVATTLKGEINSDHMVQIDGVFEGLAVSKTRIMVSEGGTLTGDVEAQEVSAFGKVNGQITANKVIIGHKGLVNATIIAEHLVIMEGGRYIGEKKEYPVDALAKHKKQEQVAPGATGTNMGHKAHNKVA